MKGALPLTLPIDAKNSSVKSPEHLVVTPEKERAIKEIIELLIKKASPAYCIEIAKIIREAYNKPTDK